jgi:hypothetical protein
MADETAEVLGRYADGEGREHEIVLVRIADGEGQVTHILIADRCGDELRTIEKLSGVDLEQTDEVAKPIVDDYVGQVERWLRGEREHHPLPRPRPKRQREGDGREPSERELLELMGANDAHGLAA